MARTNYPKGRETHTNPATAMHPFYFGVVQVWIVGKLNPWDKGYIPNKPANGYYDQFNNCDNIKNNFDYLTVPESALLWCGVPKEQIAFELKQCTKKGDTGVSRGSFIHPYISCVEPRCLLLNQAYDESKLKMGRDGDKGHYFAGEKEGKSEYGDHIAYERRTIKISDLKEFIAEYHPDDMPKTLFSDVDINKAKPITHEDYLTLTAKNEALIEKNKDLEQRLEKARDIYKDQQAKINEFGKLQSVVNSEIPLNERTETSYLNTIALLLEIMQTPKGIPAKAPFDSQNQIIQLIENMNIQGQKKSTLETRFSNANTTLEQAKKAK